MKEDLTPEEVNGHAIDIVTGGVDTVRYLEFFESRVGKKINSFYYLAIYNNKKSLKDRLKAFIWPQAVRQWSPVAFHWAQI